MKSVKLDYVCLLLLTFSYCCRASIPTVMNTWPFSQATEKVWSIMGQGPISAIDAVTIGCTVCEESQCENTVGFGGSPDENGETTLDALIFDGATMNMGAVGGLRRVKSAINVARHVLEYTKHSFLVGDLATEFAKTFGFREESLSTNYSVNIWKDWKSKNCQPNFWQWILDNEKSVFPPNTTGVPELANKLLWQIRHLKPRRRVLYENVEGVNVHPDPAESCGPYETTITSNKISAREWEYFASDNHDTIGMIAIDEAGNVVAGTSTNGANHKIPGRVGDSPIPGAGAYADNEVGAAVATGDGDIMMRFLPSFLAVEELRRGASPSKSAKIAIDRIARKYPSFFGAVLVSNKKGEFGAACNGMDSFPFSVANKELGDRYKYPISYESSN